MENVKFNGETSENKTKCTKWKSRTLVERYLVLICTIIFLALLITIGVIFHMKHSNNPRSPTICNSPACIKEDSNNPRSPTICNSPACIKEAGRIISNMDVSVDPCKDFYDFSCGSFIKHPTRDYMYYTLQAVENVSNDTFEATVEKQQPEFIKKVKQYYKSCLNQWKDIEDIVEEVLQTTKLKIWPILEDEVSMDYVEKSLAIVNIYVNNDPFLLFGFTSNRTEGLTMFMPGATTVSKYVLLNTTDEAYYKKEKYRRLLRYTLYKLSIPTGSILSNAEELIKFEMEMANAFCTSEDYTTETTLKEISASCRKISWINVVKYIYDYFGYSEDFDEQIPTTIMYGCKEYLQNLCELLESKSYRNIYNYMVWHLLAENLYRFNLQFSTSLNNIEGGAMKDINYPRWEYCVSRMIYNVMGPGLSYLVIKHLQPDKTIEEVTEYVREIKQAMDHTFSEDTWLGSIGKDIARKKVKKVHALIGYSDGSLDLELLEKHFAQVNTTDSYVETLLLHDEMRTRLEFSNDTYKFNDLLNISDPITKRAFYNVHKKEIVLTLGFLIPPYFALGVPKYVNYAAVGCIIGHEFGHAFEEMDIATVRSNETEAWPEETVKQFQERKKCYENQYSKFPVGTSGAMVNGTKTFPDNLADNFGIFQSFKAYENYISDNGEEPRLPGLQHFTNEQIFFIKYAQSWCEVVTSEKKKYADDKHSPPRYRAIGPLQNFPRFSEAFSCPVDSPMNPRRKCQMYG